MINLYRNLRPHPNVVSFLGLSTDGPHPAMILEFCSGGSLDKWVYSEKPMDSSVKFKIIKGIAVGMFHLHKNNVVHRDLAVRNILVLFFFYVSRTDILNSCQMEIYQKFQVRFYW